MKLGGLDDIRGPFPGAEKATVSNDNGVLFLGLYLFIRQASGDNISNWDNRVEYIISSLARAPGLFCRNPKRNDRREAVDNYCGIVALCSLLGLKQHLTDIYEWGEKHGYTFNNEAPEEFSISRWRQPGEVAFYKFAGGVWPDPVSYVWFIGSIIFNAFQDETTTSEHMCMWLRLKSIRSEFMPNLYRGFYELAKWFWIWKLERKTNGLGMEKIFDIYFQNKEHPCVVLSKGVKY
jgi:hypothetical protein